MFVFNPKTTNFTYEQIITMLPREIVDGGNAKNTRKIFQVPLVESLEHIMKKVPSHKHIYDGSPNWTCVDAVRIFRGWLSRKGHGSLLAMNTEVVLPNGIPHNLISFMDLERQDKHGKHPLIFGEPQTGKLIPYKISSKYTEIKLRL